MYLQNDWLMRQISSFIKAILQLLYPNDKQSYEIQDESNLSQTDVLYKKICALVDTGEICEAENLLFAADAEASNQYLKLGIDFYQSINQKNDEELEACNFSREEIKDGLQDILKKNNISIFGL